MGASFIPTALLPLVVVVTFFFKVWIALLRMGRTAALAGADLRYQVGAWARRRGWVVRKGGAFLLTMLAEAEQVLVSARGEVAGCPCTVLYCDAGESVYVACFLRLPRRFPEPVGDVLTRRHWWTPRSAANPAAPDRGERDIAFDRRFTVRDNVSAAATLLTAPVRSALLRMNAVAPLRRLRTAGDLVIVEVDGWVHWEKLDAVVEVMRAVAADDPAQRWSRRAASAAGQDPA